MKFLIPNSSCRQNPRLGGYRPQIPVLSVLNWIYWTPPPPNKIPGYATASSRRYIGISNSAHCWRQSSQRRGTIVSWGIHESLNKTKHFFLTWWLLSSVHSITIHYFQLSLLSFRKPLKTPCMASIVWLLKKQTRQSESPKTTIR